MKLLPNITHQIHTELREQFGKAPKLDNGLRSLATVADAFK
jgi:alkylhydroperoxidase/carboxymuconolactone decarboxylase family protein YurZ